MRVAIIGAGMAGLACAAALRAKNHDVLLFDKAHGPGGRMSTRRLRIPQVELSFDDGAQYMTARDPGFAVQVRRWAEQGVAAPWPAAGPDAWVGTPDMSSPVRALADTLPVVWDARVERLQRTGGQWLLEGTRAGEDSYDAVVVAVPAEQAAALLMPHAPTLAERAREARSSPCWTVMAAFAERIAIAADVVREAGAIGWAARNSAKPGRSGPEAWVVQGSPAWSQAYLEADAKAVIDRLLAALAQVAGGGLPEALAVFANRWRYARSGTLGLDALWSDALRLGACGDWLLGPRVENAWLSGQRLGRLMP